MRYSPFTVVESWKLFDIPDQIANGLKYSVRSWRSFLLSLAGAVLVLGISYDLLYSFFYTRIYNTKDARYDRLFWWSLILVAVVVPIVFAALRLISSAFQMRKFRGNTFGVAIAPFEVFSLDPGTLGAASKLQALDEVMNQFFVASQRLLTQEDWTKDFEFRILPPYARILTMSDALKQRESIGATLLIWGSVVQESKLQTNFHLLGTELDLTLTGTPDPFYPVFSLKLWSLSAAALKLKAERQYDRAKQFLILAREPAGKLDALAQGKGQGLLPAIDKLIEEIEAIQHPPAAIAVKT